MKIWAKVWMLVKVRRALAKLQKQYPDARITATVDFMDGGPVIDIVPRLQDDLFFDALEKKAPDVD